MIDWILRPHNCCLVCVKIVRVIKDIMWSVRSLFSIKLFCSYSERISWRDIRSTASVNSKNKNADPRSGHTSPISVFHLFFNLPRQTHWFNYPLVSKFIRKKKSFVPEKTITPTALKCLNNEHGCQSECQPCVSAGNGCIFPVWHEAPPKKRGYLSSSSV